MCQQQSSVGTFITPLGQMTKEKELIHQHSEYSNLEASKACSKVCVQQEESQLFREQQMIQIFQLPPGNLKAI